MTIIPTSKLGLSVARDLCDWLLLLLLLISISSQSHLVLPFAAPVVLYLLRLRGALQQHPEPFTPQQKKSVFTTRCLITITFLLASLAYALVAQNKFVWIFLGGLFLIGPVSLYSGYRDLYINQT